MCTSGGAKRRPSRAAANWVRMLCVTSNAHKCGQSSAPRSYRRARKNTTASSEQDPDRTTGDLRCQGTQKLLRTSTARRHVPLPSKTDLLAALTLNAVKLPRHDLTACQEVSQCSALYAATRPHSFCGTKRRTTLCTSGGAKRRPSREAANWVRMLCVNSNAHKCDQSSAPRSCRRARKNTTASSEQDPDRTSSDLRCPGTQKLIRTSTADPRVPLPPMTELLAAFTLGAVKPPRHDLTGYQDVSQCSPLYAATRPHSFLRNRTTHNVVHQRRRKAPSEPRSGELGAHVVR